MRNSVIGLAALGVLASAAGAQTVAVYPTGVHAAFNFVPFGSGGAGFTPIQHQVFRADLFGASPVEITKIGFAPNNTLAGTAQNLGDVTIRMGYTTRTPGSAAPVGLDAPAAGGGGAPNAAGPMTDFFTQAGHVYNVVAGGPANFEQTYTGSFTFDPTQGRNLLIEIVCANTMNTTHSVSRSAGSAESSRAFGFGAFGTAASPTTATRIQFTYAPAGAGCYPDCNEDDVLNLADFGCFQTAFALGNMYADCNGDTVLNLADFGCFQTEFALGCP